VIATLSVPAINRILRGNSWALDKLKPFAGRSARFQLPFLHMSYTVLETGEMSAASESAAADVTFTLTPGVLLRLAARDPSVWTEIAVSGDTDFATVLNFIWRNAYWDIEEDMSRVFGDIAAHRLVGVGRALDEWRSKSFDSITHSLAEYWTEEQPLIARTYDIEAFNREVDRLREDAARLEKRLEILMSRSATP
jgi:ubiquinone biosynthesis protein UbiJ